MKTQNSVSQNCLIFDKVNKKKDILNRNVTLLKSIFIPMHSILDWAMAIEPAFGTFGSVGMCQVLLENEISISIKLVSRRKHEVLYIFLVDGCVDCGLQKTQWTNTSRWHGSPNHHWLWILHTGLQATWILCLSTFPPNSGTLISKWNAKITLIWKEDFGHLSNSPGLFLFSPGKMLLTFFLFQKWFVSPFPEDIWAWWWTDSSFSPLLVKLSQVFESALLDSILKLAVIPVACAPFPIQFLHSSQLCI